MAKKTLKCQRRIGSVALPKRTSQASSESMPARCQLIW